MAVDPRTQNFPGRRTKSGLGSFDKYTEMDYASSARQTHQLLGVFPFASATPSTHVARHMSNLAIASSLPSYLQPSLFLPLDNHGSKPPYNAMASQLAAKNSPADDEGRKHWDIYRQDVATMLGDQLATNVYSPVPSQWNQSPAISSYQIPAFTQSVIQHAAPYNAYPTPPPVSVPFSSSSSSLANALGTPTHTNSKLQGRVPINTSHNSSNAVEFFNAFLDRKFKELPQPYQAHDIDMDMKPPPVGIAPSSPDLLYLNGFESGPVIQTPQMTPKKRKLVEVYIDTPSKKASAVPRSTSKKTGDRDVRGPLEKFVNLLEDIFEAEDNIPADADFSSVPPSMFSAFGTDFSRPSLHPAIIVKLTKLICKIARPSKRMKPPSSWDANAVGTPRGNGGMSEVDNQTLSRLLRLLERSVNISEEIDPFGHFVAKRNNLENEDDHVVTQSDLDALGRQLQVARDSVLAAHCCIALLTSDRLPKQLYSEELITSCLATVKTQLSRIIYTVVERPSSDAREYSPLLRCIITRQSKDSPLSTTEHRNLLAETFQALAAIIPRVNDLVCANTLTMPDSIIIQAVYIAIGPFFVVEHGDDIDSKGKRDQSIQIVSDIVGNSGMRGLRLEALSLIRSIFANYESQRSWIIEEILSSLIRLSDTKQKAGQFRLRDGRSIHTVSALLLQLIQSSVHTVRMGVHRIARAFQQKLASKRQENSQEAHELELDERDLEEISLYTSGLDAPTKAAKSIILFFTQRSGKGKQTKNVNEQEYRSIFDSFISDLMVVLFWPEWPSASLVLSILCRYMITSLDDVGLTTNENNASKSLALDHLGVIASRLRANAIKWSDPNVDRRLGLKPPLMTVEEAISSENIHGLNLLINAHQEVSSHLSKCLVEDQAFESAREFSAVLWGQELACSLNQVTEIRSHNSDDMNHRFIPLVEKIRNALRDVWNDAPMDVFDNATQDELQRIDGLAQQIGTTQLLKNAFDPILNVIILALDAPAVFVRTKALRALSQILTTDSAVLSIPAVRVAIENHLLDSSPQVRDAAVELIGKYMMESSAIADEYYQKLAERIADTGLGVRKRVIKLLKVFYLTTEKLARKVDICARLVFRMLDEDDTVKDLSVKTIEELWFATTEKAHGQDDAEVLTGKGLLYSIASIIMGVCGFFKDRLAPLEDLLSKIMSGKDCTPMLQTRFSEICDVMIEGLVDGSGFENFTVINCIRALHLFAAAHPQIITGARASTLLPYLKSPNSAEEHVTSDYILKIYRAAIPHMSKTAVKFGNDLQSLLQPMVLKPNAHAGLGSLQETVACLCSVVQYLTRDFARLIALLRSCNQRIRQFTNRESSCLSTQELRALHILVLIVSLLGEHFDFDRVRTENAELAAQVDQISTGPIVQHLYNCILRLYEKYTDKSIRGRLLLCLGFLFRAQPTLMTLESSATMMDAIFFSAEEESRARLLKLLQDFLIADSIKHSDLEKVKDKNAASGVNMEELVGNTHGFAESGVSSAIVQRYLTHILQAALSPIPHIQTSAVDILSHVIKQGLAHPLLSFPYIVALETSTSNAISAKAAALHTMLHHKHSSILNSGFVSACKKSWEYQCLLREGNKLFEIRGYIALPCPTALLSRWYSLVREKRSSRQEFLRSVLKVFELREFDKIEQGQIQFIRFMAENFATFDYRAQEEVLTVIKVLTREVAESGALLMEKFAPGRSRLQLRPHAEGIDNLKEESATANTEINHGVSLLPLQEQLSLARSSCILSILVLLKTLLKSIYGLSEEKCQKFVLGKKSVVGDRPAVRRRDILIEWQQLPYALKPIESIEDVDTQRQSFIGIWNEIGVQVESGGDEWD